MELDRDDIFAGLQKTVWRTNGKSPASNMKADACVVSRWNRASGLQWIAYLPRGAIFFTTILRDSSERNWTSMGK